MTALHKRSPVTTLGLVSTFSGRLVDPANILAHEIHIDDISRGLAHQCRFAGQVSRYYSVAEHCIWVRKIVHDWGHDALTQLAALLHDAAETYVMDLPGPIADSLPEYRAAEERAHGVVAEAFSIPHPFPQPVHDADKLAVCAEARNLLPRSVWGRFDPVPVHAPRNHHRPGESPLSPWVAEQEYKRLFYQLREEVSK